MGRLSISGASRSVKRMSRTGALNRTKAAELLGDSSISVMTSNVTVLLPKDSGSDEFPACVMFAFGWIRMNWGDDPLMLLERTIVLPTTGTIGGDKVLELRAPGASILTPSGNGRSLDKSLVDLWFRLTCLLTFLGEIGTP